MAESKKMYEIMIVAKQEAEATKVCNELNKEPGIRCKSTFLGATRTTNKF